MHTIARMTDGSLEVREGRDDAFIINEAYRMEVMTITHMDETDVEELSTASRERVQHILSYYLP